jgi:hypothetical protein
MPTVLEHLQAAVRMLTAFPLQREVEELLKFFSPQARRWYPEYLDLQRDRERIYMRERKGSLTGCVLCCLSSADFRDRRSVKGCP